MDKVARATSDQRFQLSTDGLIAYNFAVGTKLDDRCDYGQVVKIYKAATAGEQCRHSPAKIAECRFTPVYGEPKLSKIPVRPGSPGRHSRIGCVLMVRIPNGGPGHKMRSRRAGSARLPNF